MHANLVFSGKLGSGKTTVSKLLAAKLGARWGGFGVTVKRIATEQGLPFDRNTLQTLGEHLVTKTPETFCRTVISEAEPSIGQGLILDGLRHISILGHLRQILLPFPVIPIYVEVAEPIRIKRIISRDAHNLQILDRLESHSTEIEVIAALRESAQLCADNSESPETTVEGIVYWLRSNCIIGC
jgi:cytidylate kinase